MTPDELSRIYGTAAAVRSIAADEGADRTLLYGYDTDRRTHHVYQRDGVLHLMVYTDSQSGGDLVRYETGVDLPIDNLVPNKRLYPEACDYAFCQRLRMAGVHLSFADYNHERAAKTFYGLMHGHFTGNDLPPPGPR